METSQGTDDPNTVIAASCIPALLSSYPSDANALCKRIEPQAQNDLNTNWIVTCTYDSLFPDPTLQQADPTARPPKWTFGFSKFMEPQQYDTAGNAYTNSACMPFDPPFELERSRPTIEITVNKSTFNYPYVVSVVDTINLLPWQGFSANTVKCDSVTAAWQWENNIQFWELKYNLSVKWEGWNPIYILDSGMYERICTTSSSSSTGGVQASWPSTVCIVVSGVTNGTCSDCTGLNNPWELVGAFNPGSSTYTSQNFTLCSETNAAQFVANGTWSNNYSSFDGTITLIAFGNKLATWEGSGALPLTMANTIGFAQCHFYTSSIVLNLCSPFPSIAGTVTNTQQCGCNGLLKIIRDNSGAPVTGPVLLNGFGQQSTLGPIWLPFWPYRQFDFSGIP